MCFSNSSVFHFDRRVDRHGACTLKEAFTPKKVREKGLITYWGAEFEFPTCPAFSDGVRACAERGLYAFTLQNDEYDQRVAWWMQTVRSFVCDPDWVVPTHGTIFSLATALRLFCCPQKLRLIVITPGYNRYAQAASRLGLETVFSEMTLAGDRYGINWEDLERKMADPGNGLLVFSHPNNPTGRVLTVHELERIGALSDQYGMPVFCDEIFAEITRVGPVAAYVSCHSGQALAMTCTSLGKCMSLTGVNHANVLIPDPALRERFHRQKYADHYGSIDPMLHAGFMRACTEEGAAFVAALNRQIDANLRTFETTLPSIFPGARVLHPDGTFVAWVDYRGLGLSDEDLAHLLCDICLFLGDDGADYGVSRQFYRYNLAVPPGCIEDSFVYIRSALSQHLD